MDIRSIAIIKAGKNIPLHFVQYDSLTLAITLDKFYTQHRTIHPLHQTIRPDPMN